MADDEIVDYEKLVDAFNQTLASTLRKHRIADSFLDYWVPDNDPVNGIIGMIDSARIAGLSQIAIRFRQATVPEGRLAELETAVGQFATITLSPEGSHVVMRATAMKPVPRGGEKPARIATSSSTAIANPVPTQRPLKSTGKAPATGTIEHIPAGEFAEVHADFRAALWARLQDISHEGIMTAADHNLLRVESCEPPITLALDVDPKTRIVQRACHTGTIKPPDRAALDLFCVAAEGLPIQEVADHIGLKVIDLLLDPDKPSPVAGILLPVNAGPPFTIGPRLARSAYDTFRKMLHVGAETNFFSPPPSPEWQAMSPVERNERFAGGIRAFLQSENLYPDDIVPLRLEKNKSGHPIRGVIGFSERVRIADKPSLMRRLERRLRRDVERELELVADRAKDTSPLRRLS